MTMRRQVLGALRWTATSRLLVLVVSWATTLVMVRVLSPSDYGLLAMATVFVSLLTMMADFGVGAAVVQAQEIDEYRLRQVLGFVVLLDGALFLALVLAAPWIASFYDEPRLTDIVRVLAIQFLIMIFGTIPSALLSKKLAFRGQSIVQMTGVFVSSAFSLMLAFNGAGVWALVWGSLLGRIWGTIGVNVVMPFLKRPLFNLKGLRSLMTYGGQLTFARILWFIYSQADSLIAGKLLGAQALGFYSVALQLASLPVQRVTALVNQVSFPAFASIQTRQGEVARHFLLGVRTMSMAAFPVLWGISSIAAEIADVLLGTQWGPATVPLQVVSIVMPLHMLAPFLNTTAQGIGRTDLVVRQVLQAAIVMPVAFFIGSSWGLLGLSLAWVVAFPIVFVMNIQSLLPQIGLRMPDVLRAMWRPATASGGMYGSVAIARPMLTDYFPQMPLMIALIAIGAATFFALSALYNRAALKELSLLMRSFVKND